MLFDAGVKKKLSLTYLFSYFKNDTLAMIGYGSQGHGQSLNARDNGLKVIVGVREGGESWKQAMEDGWVRWKQSKFLSCVDGSNAHLPLYFASFPTPTQLIVNF